MIVLLHAFPLTANYSYFILCCYTLGQQPQWSSRGRHGQVNFIETFQGSRWYDHKIKYNKTMCLSYGILLYLIGMGILILGVRQSHKYIIRTMEIPTFWRLYCYIEFYLPFCLLVASARELDTLVSNVLFKQCNLIFHSHFHDALVFYVGIRKWLSSCKSYSMIDT